MVELIQSVVIHTPEDFCAVQGQTHRALCWLIRQSGSSEFRCFTAAFQQQSSLPPTLAHYSVSVVTLLQLSTSSSINCFVQMPDVQQHSLMHRSKTAGTDTGLSHYWPVPLSSQWRNSTRVQAVHLPRSQQPAKRCITPTGSTGNASSKAWHEKYIHLT